MRNSTEPINELLIFLFPRLEYIYGPEWEEIWQKEKRICSEIYFERYFAYSIPTGDISDIKLELFLENIGILDLKEIRESIINLVEKDGGESFINKIHSHIGEIPLNAIPNFILAFSSLGYLFSKQKIGYLRDSAFSKAALLIVNMIEKIPEIKSRYSIIEEVCRTGYPLDFPAECLQWLSVLANSKNRESPLIEDDIHSLKEIYAQRIKNESEKIIIYKEFPETATLLLYYWADGRSRDETGTYIKKIIDNNPNEAIEFLILFLTTAREMKSGRKLLGNLTPESYNSISDIIEPRIIFDILNPIFGKYLIKDEEAFDEDYGELNDEDRIALQFIRLYKKHVQN